MNTYEENDMLKAMQDRLISAPDEEILYLFNRPVVSFPFLKNCSVDAIAIKDPGVTTAFFFSSPQSIDIKIISCPEDLGYLSGEILTCYVDIDSERKLYGIHLTKPVKLHAKLLGIYHISVLWVDDACQLIEITNIPSLPWDNPIAMI